jgi:hypothetical protein
MIKTAPEYYKNFKPHVYSLDFDQEIFDHLKVAPAKDSKRDAEMCQAAATNVSRQLLQTEPDGSIWYWKEPEFTGMHPLQIELQILREIGRSQYAYASKYGRLAYMHGLAALKLLFKKTDITPSLADCVYLAMGGYSYDRKWVHFLGSMDSGKSSSMMRIAFLFAAIDMVNSFCVVGNPLMLSAKMTIMGDAFSLHHQLAEGWPLPEGKQKDDGGSALFPNAHFGARGEVRFDKNLRGKGGWIDLRSFKKKGLAVGTKGDGDVDEGHGLFCLDEINKVDSFDFFEDLENVSGQPWFLGLTSQNPRSEEDVGGHFCAPKLWGGWGWNSYEAVRRENPPIWPTELGGIAYRLNGLESVNMVLGKVIYRYLFDKRKLDGVVERYGKDSPAYKAQVLALFSGSNAEVTMLSQGVLAASRHDMDDFAIIRKKGQVLFCDPAETGDGDLAVITVLEWGDCAITLADSTVENKEMLIAPVPQEEVKFDDSLKWDKENIQKIKEMGGHVGEITVDAPITYPQQIAMRMCEICLERDIPFTNVGYDSSMEPDIVQAVTIVLGSGPTAYRYNLDPIGYPLISSKDNTEDKAKNIAEEVVLLGADVIAGKCFRGGQNVPVAVTQLRQRRIDYKKAHHPPEKKKLFKLHSGGISPDHGDSFCGAVSMAYRRGFRTRAVDGGPRSKSLFKLSKSRKKGKAKTAKKLKPR